MQITMDPGTDPALPIPTHVMKVPSTKHTKLDLYEGFLERFKLQMKMYILHRTTV